MNIWIKAGFIFKSTSSGVNVYDYPTKTLNGFVISNSNSVWANSDYLFIGTTYSGVLKTPLSSISGSLYNDLSVYKAYPDINNDCVNYVHGNGNYLCVATISGAHIFDLTTNSGIFSDSSIAPSKCYQLADRTSYYIYDDKLKTVYNDDSTYIYTAGDDIIPTVSGINDIFVVNDTIFLATTSCAVVIEENKGNEANSRFKYYYIEE